MDQPRRRFYIITVAVLLTIVVLAAVILAYNENSYVKIEVTGTNEAYFVLSYDSTNFTISASQNTTIEVLPNVNVTITAYPNVTYALSGWHASGGEVLRTGSDTISLLTGRGGSTIQVSAILVTKSSD